MPNNAEGFIRPEKFYVHRRSQRAQPLTLTVAPPTRPQALDYCRARRSLVYPNAGFWRLLCGLEGALGTAQRSNPGEISGGGGEGEEAVASLGADVVGGKVRRGACFARLLLANVVVGKFRGARRVAF